MTNPGPRHAHGARHRAPSGTPADGPARHVAPPYRAHRVAFAALVVGTAAVVTAVGVAATGLGAPVVPAAEQTATSLPEPPALMSTPTPAIAPCDLPGVAEAISAGDDGAVITALGGATAMRAAVIGGTAPCIDLSDPARLWMVVDKLRSYSPADYVPEGLARVQDMRVLNAGILRADSGAALTALVSAAADEGAGSLAITSGYRSYDNQQRQYSGRVSSLGRDRADSLSARPGYSEHQSGLAADVVACGSGCSGIDQLAQTKQGKWLAANAWRFGFVVRYEKGQTGTTGFSPEPWHIRYIGTELAALYHEGGFHTLEEFWGLPAAPDYAD